MHESQGKKAVIPYPLVVALRTGVLASAFVVDTIKTRILVLVSKLFSEHKAETTTQVAAQGPVEESATVLPLASGNKTPQSPNSSSARTVKEPVENQTG